MNAKPKYIDFPIIYGTMGQQTRFPDKLSGKITTNLYNKGKNAIFIEP